VADARLYTRQWRAAATREIGPLLTEPDRSHAHNSPKRFHSSRFPWVLSLLGCHQHLIREVDKFLDGNYLEKATFGPGSLSALEYAWHGAEESEWDKIYRNRKIVAKRALMPTS